MSNETMYTRSLEAFHAANVAFTDAQREAYNAWRDSLGTHVYAVADAIDVLVDLTNPEHERLFELLDELKRIVSKGSPLVMLNGGDE